MQYREFKGKKVSLLGFGCMRFPTDKDGIIDYNQTEKMVDYAYQNGVNYFDTAVIYHNGLSEENIGKALAKYPRESFYFADKFSSWTLDSYDEESLEKYFNNQLKKTKVGYFDFYLCHSMQKGYLDIYKDGKILNFLNRKKQEGKIKHIGFSFHDDENVLREALKLFDWEFVQIQYNYLDYLGMNAKGLYQIIEDAGLKVVIMEPVRGGKLASVPKSAEKYLKQGVSVASHAIEFAVNPKSVLTVLSGMSNFEQVEDNIKTVSNFKPLTQKELDNLEEIAKVFRSSDLVPCTKCDYCIDCPVSIKISNVFRLYNDVVLNGKEQKTLDEYNASEVKVSACIGCNKCASHCPQSIEIPKMLGKVKEVFGE